MSETNLYKDIAAKIIAMKDEDLRVRDSLIKKGQLEGGYHPEMEKVHNNNAKQLDKIIDEIGYPTINKVGKEASEAVWLIIQHAISQPTFMKKPVSFWCF